VNPTVQASDKRGIETLVRGKTVGKTGEKLVQTGLRGRPKKGLTM